MLEYAEHQLSRVVPPSERAYVKALTDAYASATTALIKTNGIYTQARLQDVINKITAELKAINVKFAEVLPYDAVPIITASNRYTEQELALALEHADIAADLYTLPKTMIQEMIDIKGINYYRIDAKGTMIKSKGVTANSMIKSIASNNIAKVRGIILAEGAIGTSPESIARKIRPFVSGDTARRDIRTVVRSLLGEANERANQKFYTENGKYIEEYLYMATLDSRTSSLCRSLDGRRFKTREPWYTPKLHPNCRSSLIAVPKGYEVGQRPIVLPDGTIEVVTDKNFTYADAVKRYPQLNNKKLINVDTYVKSLGD